jgi:hypothetical protein
MRQSLVIPILVIALMTASCSKNDSGTTGPTSPEGSAYFPFEVGRQWTYNTVTILPNGLLDPKGSHTVTMAVFQKNQLIGGQPNATVMQLQDEKSSAQNVVVYVEATKLWTYLGISLTPQSNVNWLSWYPGSYSSPMLIGVGESTKFFLYDWSGSGSFIIRRAPNSAILTASIVGADTLLVKGVAAGTTSLTLGKSGVSDTMIVEFNVAKEVVAFGPAASPWMPIVQITTSTIEQDMYSWDSTFSFKRQNGTILREHIRYRITTKFVQNETVSAAGGSITAEKHQLQLTVNETIDSTVASITYPIFDGLSAQFPGTLWMVQGIGFVKGEVSGVSISSGAGFVSISGYDDPQGVFVGTFSSPRMRYYSYRYQDGTGWEILTVNTGVPASTGTQSFALASKNF